jgi:glycosyltransferase involved in cell wall biosynthesis
VTVSREKNHGTSLGELAKAKPSLATASSSPKVSIIVPVYRNAETLHELYHRLCRVLETRELSFEIIFVDDACPANSLAILRELARSDCRVAVLVLERNVGQHRAVLAALAHSRGEWTVVMDADLQDPPEAIPSLLSERWDGVAAVFAGRRGRYESFFRLLTSRVFKGLLHVLCDVPPDAGLFVAMNRTMVERLLMLNGPRPFVVAMIGCTGLPLTSIPVRRARRPNGSSAYSFWGRLESGWRAVAWVLFWRCRAVLRTPDRNAYAIPVKARLGARFAPTGDGFKERRTRI